MLTALRFLTALPLLGGSRQPTAPLGRAIGYFPLVGAAIGLLLAGLDWLLARFIPLEPRAVLLTAGGVAVTRALHLDGLMDSCDGLFGAFTPERRLAIMRDSHLGAFGVLGGALDLLARYAALVALAGPARPVALVLAPLLGRFALAWAIARYPYAREAGLGAGFKASARGRDLALAAILASAASAAAWLPWGVLFVPATLGVAWGVARFVLSRVGGFTGDTYGALNEVIELLVLVAFASAPLARAVHAPGWS